MLESSGAFFGNESVRFGNPSYILTVETEQGKYTISVIEWGKPLLGLAEAIEVGDRIKFKTSITDFISGSVNYFSKDRIGSLYSDDIELLGK